jgi:hypothetical protein
MEVQMKPNRRKPAAAAPVVVQTPPCDTRWDRGTSYTAFDALDTSQTFDEPVQGLQIRELLGARIFRRFFGAPAAP